jgi:gliding motility-associated-like protein
VLQDPIQCGSIVPTDIRILTPQGNLNPVISATPVNCVNGVTDSILVTFYYPLTAGTTFAFTKVGFDNNTFLSECGVQMAEFDSIAFNVIDSSTFDLEIMDVGCSFNNVTVTFDYEVVCSTVTSSGSEFYLIDANGTTYPITSVSNCPGGNGYSSTLTFNLAAAISPATPVYLMVQNGTDANTFTNRCNTFIQSGDTLAQLNVLNNLIINLGNDNTICDTDPLPVLDAGVSGATYTWTLNGTTLPDVTQTITASASGTYTVFVSSTPSCQGADTVNITIVSSPLVALGADMTLCATDPIPTLDAGNPGATYQWYSSGVAIPGEVNQFFQPTGSGSYSVIVSVGSSCTGTDDIQITIDPALVVALGNDQTICSTDPYPLLNAGVPNGVYQWLLDGSPVGGNTQTLQTNAAGTYTVNVTSVSGCTGTDDFILTVIQAPVVSLGNDTTICSTDVLTLDAGNAGATYQWSLNGTPIAGATNQTYQPTATGTYSVVVNTGGQCNAGGSVQVTVVPQLTVTVADVAICSDQPYPTLDAGVTGVSYSWTFNGNVVGTTQFFQPTAPGSYDVTIATGNCSATDNFTVGTVTAPVVTPTNPVICPGATAPTLDAGNAGASYMWSTGETTMTIVPPGPGSYVVTVTNSGFGINCTATGTYNVTNSAPVVVTLGSDVVQCDGDPTITIDPGSIGTAYQWNTGETTQSITTNQGGTYTVTVTDANGCTGSDDLTLTVNSNPVVDLGADLAICAENALPTLNATNPNAATYTWIHDGSVVGTGPTFDPDHYGDYSVTIVDNNGCVGSDEISVTEAPCEVEIPNVITPENGDGLNDVFFIKNLDSNPNSKLIIFNRWGNEVYSSSNYQNNWNGGGLPDATYFYTLILQTGKKYDGTFKIIRVK